MNTIVADNHVVEIHYTLKNDSGEVLDTTDGFSPLRYIQGKNNIVAGLENALIGKKVGESFSATILPKDAYGEINPALIQVITKDKFQNIDDVQIGIQFRIPNGDGQSIMVRISEINGDNVTLDANHPLAGMNLYFDIKVESIREASKEEIHHGHLHMGAGCCGGGSGGCGKSCDGDDHC